MVDLCAIVGCNDGAKEELPDGFVFGLVWNELRKHALPNIRDILTALILTLFFGLTCGWSALGYLTFFILSTALVYLLTRLIYLIRTLLYLHKMKKTFSGVVESIGSLTQSLKK